MLGSAGANRNTLRHLSYQQIYKPQCLYFTIIYVYKAYQSFVSFHLLSLCPPLPTDNAHTLHCVSNCSPVIQFLRVASHCSSTANLRKSLSVPGCQCCFTCARMAAKSWSELGMTCVANMCKCISSTCSSVSVHLWLWLSCRTLGGSKQCF